LTAIVPVSVASFTQRLAVPLPRYAQIVDYAEPAFFGVNHPDNRLFACREIWTHSQRMAVYRVLMEAQSEVEKVVNYPLIPTYFPAERHQISKTFMLNKGYLLQVGQLITMVLQAGAAVVHTSDPAVVTIAGVSFTDVSGIHVYHPGTRVEIYPSDLKIVAGDLVISIPRVRMVATACENNPDSGLDYATPTNFEATVDVEYEAFSASLPPAEFVSLDCSINATCPTELKTDACVNVLDDEISNIRISCTRAVCGISPAFVDVYYQAGLTELTPQAEDIIVRLAHARMPAEPCGCSFLKARWDGDKRIPEVLTSERENCPWGMSDGAWQAWSFTLTMRQFRMGVI
jgi:hypothetical protein